MRLLDVESLEVRFFNENDVPEYAILSHTWGEDEVSYQEMLWINKMRAITELVSNQDTQATQQGYQNNQSAVMLATLEIMVRGNWSPGGGLPDTSEDGLMERYGYAKISEAAKEAKNLGYDYVWVDTCCIDKSSSAELQEAINSMYRWYKDAAVCLVYLNDIEREDTISKGSQALSNFATSAFSTCRWIKRGWTLQELIAPSAVRFYLEDWSFLGDKAEFVEELATATGIPIFVLQNGEPSEVSLAERMSWACGRGTTRTEDLAYCLLGLFDIQMPLLYGEGEKAFIRLQEEILKTTDDYSLFAWKAVKPDKSTYRGLLARSPVEFRDCGAIERENVPSTFPIISTPLGLRLQLEFLPDPQDKSRSLAMIRSSNDLNQRLAIRIKSLDGADQCARVDAGSLVPIDNWPTGQLRTIYVRQKLSVPHNFFAPELQCFHVRRRRSERALPPVTVINAYPPDQWDDESRQLRIPEEGNEFHAVIQLQAQSSFFQIVCGFHRKSQYYWCKVVKEEWPDSSAAGKEWQAKIAEVVPRNIRFPKFKDDLSHDDIFVIADSGIGINISMRAAMCEDDIAVQVLIDGLAMK